MTADPPLTLRERLLVRGAVQRGERLPDARLARAAVASADRYLKSPVRSHLRQGAALAAGGLVVLAVVSVVTGFAFTVGGATGLVAGFLGGQLLILRPMTERRVRQAREANARVGKVGRRKGRRTRGGTGGKGRGRSGRTS